MKLSGVVFPIPTAVLTDEKYKALKEKYPQDITADCDKWLKLLNRRRTGRKHN
jgi:hypothetical protein